jgi:hypothetical protein
MVTGRGKVIHPLAATPSPMRVRLHVDLHESADYTFEPDAPLRLTANPRFVYAYAQTVLFSPKNANDRRV